MAIVETVIVAINGRPIRSVPVSVLGMGFWEIELDVGLLDDVTLTAGSVISVTVRSSVELRSPRPGRSTPEVQVHAGEQRRIVETVTVEDDIAIVRLAPEPAVT